MLMAAKTLAFSLKNKFMDFITKEDGEVNIVTIVVLIGIAVALALIFKDAIIALLGNLFDTITEQATEAVGGN